MVYRTYDTANIGWCYTKNPAIAATWQDNSRGYFANVETVPDSLGGAIVDALSTAEELGYFFFEGVAESLFLAESENDITRIMCTCRHQKPVRNLSKKYGSPYYENCRIANRVYSPIMGKMFPAWTEV